MSIGTAVRLDEDIYERLKQESRVRGLPFRQTLNEVLRMGLTAAGRPGPRTRSNTGFHRPGLQPLPGFAMTESSRRGNRLRAPRAWAGLVSGARAVNSI